MHLNEGFQFLSISIRSINQDSLENFSIIRQKRENCDNTTLIQFACLFKQVCCHALLNPRVTANCKFDLSVALATVASGKADRSDVIAPLQPPLGADGPVLPPLGSHAKACLNEN